MNNIINQTPYIRTSRNFPNEISQLSLEISRTYVDIANAINQRTISIFPKNLPAITGESWFIENNIPQQGFRQIYTWDDTLLVGTQITIPHSINFGSVFYFVRVWGIFIDGGGVWQTLPYVDVVAITNQIKVSVSSTNIIITKGATAPASSNGLVILEWITKR